MKPVAWFWSLYALWLAVLFARLAGRVSWPWVWVLSPWWVIPLAFALFAGLALAWEWTVCGWLWVREVIDARRRLRFWRAFSARSLTTLTTPDDTLRGPGMESDPRPCKPPFHRDR